jgi:glyoxylase-like metal-dependent hydrolase (beta-lactamase superfamily II)
MHTGIEGLYASEPEALPFAQSLDIRAFLLRRDQGNVLIYSVAGLEAQAATIEELGGIDRQLLNHQHEAMFLSPWLSAPLFVHERDADATAERSPVAGTFSEGELLDGDLEVIPTPGHTPGATAYLWDTGEHRLLFTGDTIMLVDGEWVAAVLPSSDRALYLESLDLMRTLEFDVLVPWVATGGRDPYVRTDPADARTRLDRIIQRVRSGAEG